MILKNKLGFTLLELSIVLVIVSFIAGAGIVAGSTALDSVKNANTVNRLNTIETALMAFRQSNNRLPCPTDGTLTEASTGFGVESANPGSCTGGSPAVNFTAASLAEGTVPVRTLNLPDDFAYDGWGRKIAYSVWTPITGMNSFYNYGIVFNCGLLTVKDASGAVRTSQADYVLLSYGPDGHGGYNALGAKYSSASVNGNEQVNCHCNNAAVDTGFTGNYIMMDATLDPLNFHDPFDDIVRYKERWQMQNQYDQYNPGGWLVCTNSSAPGFRADGTNASDASGTSVAVGDVNGDGIPDLIIGAPGYNLSTGAVYVVFGTTVGFPDPLTLGTLNGTNGFRINGVLVGDNTGFSVASGDVNGDGISDIIIGAKSALLNKGSVFVVFGVRGTWPATFNLSTLTGANGTRFDSILATGNAGASVAAGDVNNDGYADIVIGAPATSANAGEVYVVFGAPTFALADYTLDGTVGTGVINGTKGFSISPLTASDKFGTAVAAGDANGDGIADVAGGQPGYSASTGMASMMLGRGLGSWYSPIPSTSLNGYNGWHAYGSAGKFGSSVAVGDVNGDGVGDILIGAPAASPGGRAGAGITYVLFGYNEDKEIDAKVSNENQYNGFELDGVTAGDASGTSVAVGDINHDGVGDIIIGAPNATVGANANAGKTYVVFGSTAVPASTTFALSTVNGTNGFELDGATAGEHSGSAVATGDLNGDWKTDVVIGAPSSGRGGTAGSGTTYVYYGQKKATWTNPFALSGF